jgi:23S rRNA (cytosine1962-C5)-methyltransferase
MAEGVLRLKRGSEAKARAHPWIFKGDVADVSEVEPGAVVTVVDGAGRFVGRGFFNPRPALCCRLTTWQDEPLDAALLARRVEQAARLRRQGDRNEPARLLWSEADGLPGLVVDRYGPVLVIQCLTLGMALRREAVAAALRSVLGDLPIFSADDPGPARLEGFVPARGWLDRPGPDHLVVDEGKVRLRVVLGTGQKTGLYLDQRDNRLRLAALARDREVLDVFCYSGAFTCHALVGGARRAVGLESSPEALAMARENFVLNGVSDRAELIAGNAFDELRRLERMGARFGLIVLDPPPFARSRAALDAAARGYKEVNLRAMRLLTPGGWLATFSCSHHISPTLFEDICRHAAADANVRLRLARPLGQAADHPIILTIPETSYLKGLLLQAA